MCESLCLNDTGKNCVCNVWKKSLSACCRWLVWCLCGEQDADLRALYFAVLHAVADADACAVLVGNFLTTASPKPVPLALVVT